MKKVVAFIICCMLTLTMTMQAAAIVKVPVTGILLNTGKITLQVGQASTLKATLSPANTTQRFLTFVTSNKNVASIDNDGNITAVNAGNAVITVITQNKDISAKVTVTVLKKGKTVELKVEVFDRGAQGQPDLNNNNWTRFVNDNFGKKYNVKVTYVPVIRSQEIDKMNILMAAGTAPDICLTYDQSTVLKYVKSNGLKQLDDLLKDYGSNLSNYLAPVLKYGQYNKKQMVIPAKRTQLMQNNCFIRKDWLDKLGLPMPKTRDDLYKCLVAFRDKNPGEVSNVVPWVVSTGTTSNLNLGNSLDSFRALTEEQRAITNINGNTWLMNWVKPGQKEAYRWMNKLYHEKLLSADFALDKTGKQGDADIANGRGGFFGANWDYPYRDTPGIYKALKANVPTAELVAVDCFQNTAGKYEKPIYNQYGVYILIPEFSKSAVQAIQYLDWMANKDNIFYLQFGEEGVNHKTEDGLPVPITQTGDKMMMSPNNIDYEIITNGPDLFDEAKNRKMFANNYKAFGKEVDRAIELSLQDGVEPYYMSTPNAALAKYGPILNNKNVEISAQLTVCKPSEFDEKYDSLVGEFIRAGASEIVSEQRVLYRELKK